MKYWYIFLLECMLTDLLINIYLYKLFAAYQSMKIVSLYGRYSLQNSYLLDLTVSMYLGS